MGRFSIFAFFVILTFILQIGVSFYYSSEIVSQNTLFNKSQRQLSDLTLKNQNFRLNLDTITSVEYLNQHLPPKLAPIDQTIDLH